MRAVGVTEFGGPEALHIVDLPDPEAGPGQLRIRVHGAAVNPTDTVLRSGARADMLRDTPPPYVPGMDAAGVLEQVGDGVSTDLRVGDHVMAIVVPRGSHGAYSERVVVPAESVARVPAGATDVEATTLPMNGLTARLALDVLRLQPGQTLAVTGAAGAVGGYAVQLAKADGLRVIADASPDDEQLVKDLGADIVIRRGAEFSERVRDAVPQGADAVLDLRARAGQARPSAPTGGGRPGDAPSGTDHPGRAGRGGTPHPRGGGHPGAPGSRVLTHPRRRRGGQASASAAASTAPLLGDRCARKKMSILATAGSTYSGRS
ncbi:MAG: putative zinc-binding oxidoreductase, partial [Chloroflexi bacterium]|jgi:NADPH2:quinone reductase|nr:putative zinc-binding oxidoreductase [Chloroflexota bacterium]